MRRVAASKHVDESVLARLLLNRGFDFVGVCNFKWLWGGRNRASDNCRAMNRSIRFQWHSVNQFFASRNADGTFKQIGFARVVKPIFVIAL
jgi:hypothetical protein